jgi:O-antigen/teichoic acid export membrane protein
VEFSLKSILHKVGIDGAVGYTILTRGLQAGGGLISILFIARYLSADEQGYFYTFGSLLAIQIFFELGLSGIITQYTAHEFAHLKWEKEHELIGDIIYKSRLSSLLRFFSKWFLMISGVLFVALVIIGFHFFSKYGKGITVEWKGPWIILSLATVMNLFIDPVLAFFDGLGRVKDMAQVRLIQKSSNILFLFLFLLLGFKLYSSPLASLLSILINYIQVFLTKRVRLLKAIWASRNQWVISYMKEIFPFQWKIAVSWIGGYFIFQLFNPILFATEGPVVAGQMGMTMAALNGMIAISISWLTTKVPLFSGLIANNDFLKLDEAFDKMLKGLIIVSFFLLAGFNIVVWFWEARHLPYSNRFLPVWPTFLLSLAFFLNQFTTSWATYLRCHKKEPFLIQTIVVSILSGASILIFGKEFGLMGMVYSYSFMIGIVSTTWGYVIFITKKHKWHAQ